MMTLKKARSGLIFFTLATSIYSQTARMPPQTIHTPVEAEQGMLVTSEPLATRVGLEILQQGGNAVDAAVAVGFALAVTLPRAGNIGGGGFMLIHLAETGETVAIDYREMAPALAHRDMFLDDAGNVDDNLSRRSHLSSGVPGTVAGLAHALKKYGTLTLPEVMAPAIRLADEGFTISPNFAGSMRAKKSTFMKWESTREIFMKDESTCWESGDRLIQNDLARTLSRISKNGPEEFYRGQTADLLVSEMKRHGGFIRKRDMEAYQPVERTIVRGDYRGYEILSMPPPSSGGAHVIQMLNMLEGDDLSEMGYGSARGIHLTAEAMKRAYADRAEYMGDPGFCTVPVEGLTSKAYAAELRKAIDTDQAAEASDISHGKPADYESDETTHFSIVDRHGNCVANTYTINFSYGSGIVVKGGGFFLNNEMDDFSSKPGVPNGFGLIGGEANAIQAGKRPLSSMTPVIILKEGKPWLITGSPGGSRIITTVLQVILNVIDYDMNIQEAVSAPRFHHQ